MGALHSCHGHKERERELKRNPLGARGAFGRLEKEMDAMVASVVPRGEQELLNGSWLGAFGSNPFVVFFLARRYGSFKISSFRFFRKERTMFSDRRGMDTTLFESGWIQ